MERQVHNLESSERSCIKGYPPDGAGRGGAFSLVSPPTKENQETQRCKTTGTHSRGLKRYDQGDHQERLTYSPFCRPCCIKDIKEYYTSHCYRRIFHSHSKQYQTETCWSHERFPKRTLFLAEKASPCFLPLVCLKNISSANANALRNCLSYTETEAW